MKFVKVYEADFSNGFGKQNNTIATQQLKIVFK